MPIPPKSIVSALLVTAASLAAQISEPPITVEDRRHWSFRPLRRPSPPSVAGVEGAIDRFVRAELAAAELEPMPPADRRTLIRRLSFDLIGLPPTAKQIEKFVTDDAPGAYQRLVDRLLAAPAHGERWAQFWLDLARFAETDGFEHDRTRPQAWQYRDWVIRALNRDLPFDQFVRLQLAGDELEPDNADAALATGFLMAGPDMPDINRQDERRDTKLNEMTGAVGSVFLGLTFGCAQCHDHKFDPISQADFYRLRAVFENTVWPRRDKLLATVAREPSATAPPSHLMIRGDFRRAGPAVEPAFVRIANQQHPVEFAATKLARSSGRRTALANRLTRPDHPLVARVIVNRLWQHHFGRGLVDTPSDFGRRGGAPSHPRLLDWLATELPTQAWSLKAMHKLIVMSAAYRRASRPGGDDTSWRRAVRADPDNRLLWRGNRRRLEGEAIRDSMLAVAGRLSDRRGGPGVRPPLPTEVTRTLLKNQWQVSPNRADHDRRSVYLFARRNLRFPLFDAFDRPDANSSCARRNRSTTAPQSLMLLNSEFSLDTARRFAGLLFTEASSTAERVRLAYLRAFARAPSARELRGALAFLAEQAGMLRREGRPATALAQPDPTPDGADRYAAAALVDYCLALFNLNEFVYVD